ncbi:MAG: LysR family transcriptional regulator [Alphaproteobacteria bacterium]|nr:LysR family transcriptional regulator [Alphaproteobacteria bacterium]
MDWDKLRIFHAVAEAGSFTAAGKDLHLSQSAVSRQIAALEQDLSVALFHRHSRGLILTEPGERLRETAREVFAKLAMTEAQLSESRDRPSGHLTVTTTLAFGSIWLTPRLKEFNRLYPDISLTLLTSDATLDLAMREADVGIRMGVPTEPDLVRRHLMTIHSHIYAAPSYIAEHGKLERPADLARHRLIVYGLGPLASLSNPDWMIELSGDPETRKRIVLVSNNVYSMLQAVESGLGIASLPDYAVAEQTSLVRVLPEHNGPSFECYFVYAEEMRHSARVTVFRDYLQKQVANYRF